MLAARDVSRREGFRGSLVQASRLMTFLLYLLCSPWDAVLVFLSLVLRPLIGQRWFVERGVVWLEIREGGLVYRLWPFSTTLGHLVLLQPGVPQSTIEHELVHVRQYEAAVCGVYLAAVVVAGGWTQWPLPWALLPAVLLAPWFGYFGASLAAWMRGQRGYLDNAFERHARAETEGDVQLDPPTAPVEDLRRD